MLWNPQNVRKLRYVIGSMDLWIYGSMDLWIYGSMDLWIYASRVHNPRVHGSQGLSKLELKTQRCICTYEPPVHQSTTGWRIDNKPAVLALLCAVSAP